MTRFGALFFLVWAATPLVGAGAEITRVASSFEDDHPFGMFIDVGFERTQKMAKISHESHQAGALIDAPEMRYVGSDSRLNADVHVGLWRDLEFHFGVPIVFDQSEAWWLAAGTNPSNSTITNNCVNPNGTLTDPSCPTTGQGAQAIFPVPNNTYRGGIGNMRFGLAYALFNQQKDDTKPMWIIGLEYEAPTADLLDPSVPTSPTVHGKVGDHVHKYRFYTSFSRRIGWADPYFQAYYQLPYPGPGWYSNCLNPSATNMAHPENCSNGSWSLRETGIQAPHRLGALFGSEFSLIDDAVKHQKLALDVRGIGEWVSGGRYYNEMSGLLGKYLATQDYLQVGGSAGLTANASDYVRFRAIASLLYDTDHLLTGEAIGRDPSMVPASSTDFNPNFDYRVDPVGRRFVISEQAVFRIDVTATFVF